MSIFRSRYMTNKTASPYDARKLLNAQFSTSYNIELSNRFSALQDTDNTQNTWINFREAITGAAQTILGRRRGTKKGRWITDSQ